MQLLADLCRLLSSVSGPVHRHVDVIEANYCPFDLTMPTGFRIPPPKAGCLLYYFYVLAHNSDGGVMATREMRLLVRDPIEFFGRVEPSFVSSSVSPVRVKKEKVAMEAMDQQQTETIQVPAENAAPVQENAKPPMPAVALLAALVAINDVSIDWDEVNKLEDFLRENKDKLDEFYLNVLEGLRYARIREATPDEDSDTDNLEMDYKTYKWDKKDNSQLPSIVREQLDDASYTAIVTCYAELGRVVRGLRKELGLEDS